jgi:hypothetical protein
VRACEIYLDPSLILSRILKEIKDATRAEVVLKFYLSTLDLLSIVSILFPDDAHVLTDEKLDRHANEFIHEVQLRKQSYDLIAGKGENSYDNVIKRKEDDKLAIAKTLANYILKVIGLGIRRKRATDGNREQVSYIANGETLRIMLRLRNRVEVPENFAFSKTDYLKIADEFKSKVSLFDRATPQERQRILHDLEDYSLDAAIQLNTQLPF